MTPPAVCTRVHFDQICDTPSIPADNLRREPIGRKTCREPHSSYTMRIKLISFPNVALAYWSAPMAREQSGGHRSYRGHDVSGLRGDLAALLRGGLSR